MDLQMYIAINISHPDSKGVNSYMYQILSWIFKPFFTKVSKGQFIDLKPKYDFSKITHDIYTLQTIETAKSDII